MRDKVTPDIVREFFDYNADTGKLYWRDRDRKWFVSETAWKSARTKCAGKEAGTKCTKKNGYSWKQVHIPVEGKPTVFLVHRLIWMWVTGENPPENIDHINRDATDNRWVNLRASNSVENNKNKTMKSNNTSGYCGVTWVKRLSKWQASIRTANQRYYLGVYSNLDDAISARKKAEGQLGFHEGHGERR